MPEWKPGSPALTGVFCRRRLPGSASIERCSRLCPAAQTRAASGESFTRACWPARCSAAASRRTAVKPSSVETSFLQTLRCKLHVDAVRDQPGFERLGHQLLDCLAPPFAVAKRQVVHIHSDELVRLGAV